MNNTAYIDTFFSFICSELTEKDILPNFPIYYGSLNGIMEKYNLDITEDYHDFKEEAWFHKNLGDQFKMDIYMDSDSEDENDYISVLKNIPCQLFFIEKLDGLLSELLINDFNDKIILSCLFQVSYGLAYLQKHLKLHIMIYILIILCINEQIKLIYIINLIIFIIKFQHMDIYLK